MEVFADIDFTTKLVKVSTMELARIMGFESTYDSAFDKAKIAVGKTIDVVGYSRVSSSVKNLNTGYLSKIAENLEAAVSRVREAGTLVDEMNCFDKLKG